MCTSLRVIKSEVYHSHWGVGGPTFHGLYLQELDKVLIVKNQKRFPSGEGRGKRVTLVKYIQSLLNNKGLTLQGEELNQSLFSELWQRALFLFYSLQGFLSLLRCEKGVAK